MSHWSGSRSLAPGTPHQWTLTETPLGHPVVVEILSLHTLQQVIDGVDVKVGQSKAQDVGLGVVELINLGHWDHLPQVRGRASSPRPLSSFWAN